MIITLKKDTPEQEEKKFIQSFKDKGMDVTISKGVSYTVLGIIGDTTILDEKIIGAHPFVDNVQRVAAPYKKANRLFHPEDTVVDVAGIKAVSYTHLDVQVS